MKIVGLCLVVIIFTCGSCKTQESDSEAMSVKANKTYSCPKGSKPIHSCVGVTPPSPHQVEREYALVCESNDGTSLALLLPNEQPEFKVAEVAQVGERVRYSAKFYDQAFDTQLIISSGWSQNEYSAFLKLADNSKSWPMTCTAK